MEKPSQDRASYNGMLKSTSTLAGAKVITILISIVRTKIVASLLGPSGIGLVNLVTSSTDLARVFFACGLDSATTRRVAEASGSDDPRLLDRTFRISARTALIAGFAACLALAAASPFLSHTILGDQGKFWWYGFGALSLIFTPLLGVELAFLQGLRKSRDLALCQIIASFVGAILNIILVSLMGVAGGVAALLPLAVVSLIVHHSFLKRYRPVVSPPLEPVTAHHSVDLLKLGSGFAVNGIWLTASGWLNLFFITRYYGTAEGSHQVGLYGAAATMSNLYIGILVSAMATEFYPALVQAARDRSHLKRLLNQQTVLAMSVGMPATLGLLALAPIVLQLLYSNEFVEGAEIMRWMLAAMAVRFASCPLGYTLFATSSPRVIMISELAMGAVMITSSFLLLQVFGVIGIGIALLATNLLYLFGVVIIMHRRGVHWTLHTSALLLESAIVLGVCLSVSLLIPGWHGITICALVITAYSAHLLILIQKESGIDLALILQKIRSFLPKK
ncbi:oligosaccharide flippase family protein [Akkermansiaceae bacterium]|nr:oligosaccharide flippase family protein [Akkermansiaceae bacterium]